MKVNKQQLKSGTSITKNRNRILKFEVDPSLFLTKANYNEDSFLNTFILHVFIEVIEKLH